MDLNFEGVDYSVLYDKAPIMKKIIIKKDVMTDVEKKEFISKVNKAYQHAKELSILLKDIYSIHSNRNLSDAIASTSETLKSINLFNSSLQ